MKKTLACVLALLLLLSAGCAPKTESPKNETDKPSTDNTNTSTSEIATDFTEDNSATEPQFDESVPLFGAQDRSDIEGDRYVVYYYNHKGDLLKSSESETIGFYAKNGLAPAYDPATSLIGFVDRSGVFVIEPQWDDAAAFSDDGIALVIKKENDDVWGKDKFGFINEKGEQIIPCIYDDATSFYPAGVAIIAIDEKEEKTYTDENGEEQTEISTVAKWGLIDKTGTVIIQPQYDSIDHIEGDYVICRNTNPVEVTVYDLSGKVLVENFAESIEHQLLVIDNQLFCNTREIVGFGQDLIWRTNVIKTEIYEGSQFVEQSQATKIEVNRVATTTTGYGYGVVHNDEVVIPYQYDLIMQAQDYFVAIKFQDGDIQKQSIDIYNKNFERTASNLDYNYYRRRTEAFGTYAALPSGYFDVFVYDSKIDRDVHGIIDASGEIVVPFLFYRGIKLYTYEGIGGKFN